VTPATDTEFLCDLYAEVSQHLDLEESVPVLFARLRQDGLLIGIAILRWEAESARLEPVVAAGEAPVERRALPTPHADELVRWGRARRPGRWLSRGEARLPRLLVGEGAAGPLVAVPLGESELAGVLVLFGAGPAVSERADTLAAPFRAALANHERVHELRRLREAAEGDRAALLARLSRQDVSGAVVGATTGLAEVMRRVAQVAPTDAPVLILGETGSGKEVVARAVHEQSRRAAGPFLRVNCGAIPAELVDSELFGHEKGAFTGAVATRKGWFERADGGTLFLDEVAELPLAAQVRLLRVLQDGTVQRVGGHTQLAVSVRLVAATHRDMATMVHDGSFRKDLWYRVSVFPVALPALRERPGDIAPLGRHFAAQSGQRLYGRPLLLSADDERALGRWSWPGNVRELAAVIERAAILGGGHRLDVATALGSPAPGATPTAAPPVPVAPVEPGDERERLERAVREARGRIEGPFGAAAALGVNPHTLRSRLRRLGVAWAVHRPRRP
jgi:transcriptional regulator with GAF, ATPase, and Fis domain